MTETDATHRPLEMPEKFIPYLEKYRVYKIFKDMVRDLVLNLPRDHLKHMKMYLNRHLHCPMEAESIMMLISPELKIDTKEVVKQIIRDLGFFVITRRCVMDKYEKHDDYVPGCVSPALMSEVVKMMTLREPVPSAGWLMFDHPCTVREARCLQQDGVLPTITLLLIPTPPVAPPAANPYTRPRTFFEQDFEGLKYAYKATLKEIHINPDEVEDIDSILKKCFNAIRACAAGAQGPQQGIHVVGAPGTYRVLLIGPRGSGRRSQGEALAKHFGFVYMYFGDLLNEAMEKDDDIGYKLRNFGPSIQLKGEIVKRRLLQKDCVDHGWVLTGYPTCGTDFEILDTMTTPPNRIIFLNVGRETCKNRSTAHGVDWCTGKILPAKSGPRVKSHPRYEGQYLEADLDFYFTEALAEMRAAAGITAVEIDAEEPFDTVQVRIQAAVMSAPSMDIEISSQIQNACGD